MPSAPLNWGCISAVNLVKSSSNPTCGCQLYFFGRYQAVSFPPICSRVVQCDTVYRSMNWKIDIPVIKLHVFVGVKGLPSERSHRKFPIPFGLSLERKEEQRGDCQGNRSPTSPGKLCHVALPFSSEQSRTGRAYNEIGWEPNENRIFDTWGGVRED